MEKDEHSPINESNNFSSITNVLRAIQLAAVGVNPGTIDKIRNSLNPAINENEVVEILNILIDGGLVILDAESKSYFITDDGRRVMTIGI